MEEGPRQPSDQGSQEGSQEGSQDPSDVGSQEASELSVSVDPDYVPNTSEEESKSTDSTAQVWHHFLLDIYCPLAWTFICNYFSFQVKSICLEHFSIEKCSKQIDLSSIGTFAKKLLYMSGGNGANLMCSTELKKNMESFALIV